MITRVVDNNNDWAFGKGRNDYLKDLLAVEQSIKTRLQSFLGDCFFDINSGIDWFHLLGAKNKAALELAVKTVICNTRGITGIVSFGIDLDSSTRVITMNYVLNTVFSNGGVDQTIEGSESLILTEGGDVLTTEDGSGILAG